jgi:nucleotide-binding universal stress UspA family protein
MLGPIAAAVVRDAQCDVLIVQGKQERRSTPP